MIREMRVSDIPALVALAKEFFARGPLWAGIDRTRPINAATLSTRLRDEIEHPDILSLTAEKNGDVVGCITVGITQEPLFGDIMACKMQWIADPEKGRGMGRYLMLRAECWAREHGAAKFVMSGMNDKTTRLLEAAGYLPLEIQYQKDL